MAESLAPGFRGRVVGAFESGFYVAGPAESLFAVLGRRSWPGPLHLVVAELPSLPAVGERVRATGTRLETERLAVRLDECRSWNPSLPSGLGLGPRLWEPLSQTVGSDLAPCWDGVAGDLRQEDLAAACRRLEGRGPGLTPSGDDALAGIMLVRAMDRGQRTSLDLLARSARTSRLSRAFLRWAAAGQSIQPAHAVLEAAASGDRAGWARAARALAAVGATSGRALLAGLALAAANLPPAAISAGAVLMPTTRPST